MRTLVLMRLATCTSACVLTRRHVEGAKACVLASTCLLGTPACMLRKNDVAFLGFWVAVLAMQPCMP
jgi:hypothetical protein